MPTEEQLFKSWRTQHALGISDSQYYCNDYAYKSLEEVASEKEESNMKFTGHKMGIVVYNKKTEELDILIKGSWKYNMFQISKFLSYPIHYLQQQLSDLQSKFLGR